MEEMQVPKKKSSQPKNLPRRVAEGLYEANELLEKGQPEKARSILEELAKKHPRMSPVLELLVNACYDLQDMHGYEWAIYRLLKEDRNHVEAARAMAGAYMLNLRPALAIQAFESYLRRWPDDERAEESRKTVADLRQTLMKEMSDLDLPEAEALDLARQHEEVRFYLDHGQYRQGQAAAENLLKQHPSFVPALNNLSQLHVLQGDPERAIALIGKVLEIEPENIHALSNLTRLLFLSGQAEEAAAMAQRLKQSVARAAEPWSKKAEALSFLGDEDGIIELLEQARAAGALNPPLAETLFMHLAAVALWNKGQPKEAQQLWKKVLEINPAFDLAKQQLDDLNRPASQRNGPWAFPLSYWIGSSVIRDLTRLLSGGVQRKSEQVVEQGARLFLEKHPEVIFLAPHILARGDAEGREFICTLARIAETPELLDAIRDFALGQRGSDKLRMEMAQFLADKDRLPPGPARLWLEGEWREILLMSFEITAEPMEEHADPRVRRLSEKAIEALRAGDGQEAQRLLEEAIALDPDTPSLQNNLGMAYQLQGQAKRAHELVREIHARFPDYFFGLIGVARLAIHEKDVETARRLLSQAVQRKRLHVTEFDALCMAHIDLCLAEKNREAARTWFQLWERPDPDNPQLGPYRARLFDANILQRLLGKRG
jgi:tetratricopeptide (TPR) repeat protein